MNKTGKTILVVDDEAPYRRVCRGILEKCGHRVFTAADSVAALRVIANNPVDLVISDVLMPNRDGIETIIAIHREHPEIRIIMMSGGGVITADNVLKLAGRFYASATLRKPFTSEQLLDTVASVLKRETVRP